MPKKRKVPKVRLAKPAGRPWQIRYTPVGENREVRISTQTEDKNQAIEQQKEIEAKLLLGVDPKPRKIRDAGPLMPWSQFRDQYSRLKVATMRSSHSRSSAEYRLDVCESIISPATLGQMSEDATLARLQAELLAGSGGNRKVKKARSPHTVRSYLATLIAALNWTHRPMKWLPEPVEFELLEVDEPDKGRPLCAEEFERMLAAVPKAIETEDATAVASWQRLLRGLWESGLRLSEAMSLHWTADGAILPHWRRSGLLLLHIPAKMQKNRKAQDVPTTPAFAAIIAQTSEADRSGWIFDPISRKKGTGRMTTEQVGRTISLIGEKANVAVNADGKSASAHDLRRSFGQRMADAGLPPRDLQAIMRHASFTTTEQYYLRDRAHDQGERIAKYLGTVAKAEEPAKAPKKARKSRTCK
ncbi:tyrosine-type recombinase/integrase [Anatilimnocola aggregata]|uniref:tyrosine-type recombinase/integrase n=1 Tax=Anatilimnocola aggregata TaxID=2528021 RepID=UPI00119FCA48|nr:site-specific integrase [Anatilimnocola aggregata]